jgi:predicted esterase
LLGAALSAAEPATGLQPEVTVSAETRLDWIYCVANQSAAQAPPEWLEGYDSTAQRYQLYVPPGYTARGKKTWPLVLFISPGDEPAGWEAWQAVAEREGVLFASPYAAGNSTPGPRRVRIVLDVLDDIRRQYRIDTDRLYLGGFSGGGRIAASIAFALPELFGGVVPVCAAGSLRDEPWLWHRATDRLSAALITGETDFNRGEVERFRGPMLTEVGLRTRVWVVPGVGHGIPGPETMTEAFDFLEEGVAARRKLARDWPASRIAPDAAPTRDEWSQLVLAEAQKRLQSPRGMYRGLMQLSGLAARWPDTPAAQEATELLTEYDARSDRPWEEDDLAEQRKFLVAQARSLDAYVSGPLPPEYAEMRDDMLKAALELWRRVVDDQPDSPAGQQGQERIEELEAMLAM